MPNTILYLASTADEVNQCAYSLLKYLELYNLKPPPDHRLVIYTKDPASLEIYGSFFNHFELRELTRPVEEVLEKAKKEYGSQLIYMAPGTYPLKPLENNFPENSGVSAAPVGGSGTIGSYLDLTEFNPLLRHFFKKHHEESVPNQVKLIHHIDAISIRRQRDAFNQLPMLTRLFRKALGKGWSISSYLQKI